MTRICVKSIPLSVFFGFSARLRIIFGELGLVGSGNEPHIIRVKTDDPLLKMGEKGCNLILIWNVASIDRFRPLLESGGDVTT